jgi:hypothetical protein
MTATSFAGSGANLTGVADATKLPLAGGTMTGTLNVSESGNNAEIKVGTQAANTHQGYSGVQFEDRGFIGGYPNDSLGIFYNTYHSSGSKAIETGTACNVQLLNGGIRFQTAASVSADAAQSFTDRLEITTGGRVVSQSNAHAWLTMNGTGTISISDSYNVSSIADNGTGFYDMNFDVDMANANYAAVGNSGQYAGSINPYAKFTATYAFKSFDDNAAAADDANIMIIAFGDTA